MKILNLIPGSPEWHNHRATARNASEAPIIMGSSSKTTRQELIRLKSAGHEKEFSDWVVNVLFENGHQVEAKARPIIEAETGADLYPIVGTTDDGYLSASFDGHASFGDESSWECKQWNETKAGFVRDGKIPPDDYWQVVQQSVVNDGRPVRYTLSNGTPEKTLSAVYHLEPAHKAELLAAWAQFDADLAAYVPQPVKAEVVAAPVETLPAIVYQIDRATMALTSNLPDFRAAAEAMVERTKAPLATDQDFADREALCKAFGEAEKLLKMKAEEAVGQISDVAAFARELGDIAELFRTARLASEKLVDAEKKNRRAAIQQAGEKALADHIAALQARFAGRVQMPATRGEFAGAIKGKRTLTSIQDAVDAELAKRKIEANQLADGIDANLRALDELAPDHGFLFRDLQQLVAMPAEAFRATVEGRVATHKAQEQARIEAEVQAKLAAEKAAQQQAEAPDPKPEPVASATASAAGTAAPSGRAAPIAAPQATTAAPARPTDRQIIDALASHFGANRRDVVQWLKEMDFSAEGVAA